MKIFECPGRMEIIEDAMGQKPSKCRDLPVYAEVYYKVPATNGEAMVVKLYGCPDDGFLGFGQTTHKLTLDNGVTLEGNFGGGDFANPSKRGETAEGRLYDLRESQVQLYPDDATEPDGLTVDSLVFPLAASYPLGHGVCASRDFVATPGKPLSVRPFAKRRASWSPHAVRLELGDLLILISETNQYWLKYFDARTGHESLGAIRSLSGQGLDWESVNEALDTLEAFLGWLNHCQSPITVLHGYRRRKLVYRRFRVRPGASAPRDYFSWLPRRLDSEDGHQLALHDTSVQCLFDKFATMWVRNKEEQGNFHLALRFLRSNERGSPHDEPSVLYSQHCFTALSILLGMMTQNSKEPERLEIVKHCLRELSVPDRMPADELDLRWLSENCNQLWVDRHGNVDETAFKERRMSRPISNLQNWFAHFGETDNASRVLGLPYGVQKYMVELVMWLADLMLLKVVGHRGYYFNRLDGKAEVVPWSGHG